jgi:VWFA-related protein
LALLLLLGSAWPASAQGVVSLTIDDLVFDEFPVVLIPVTVRNENGVPIVGLEPDQFEIVEDGRSSFRPSEVDARVNAEATISVIMAIDASGSMEGEPIEEAMRAANTLIDELSEQDRGAIVAFADEVNIDPDHIEEGKEIDFTTDKNALRNVVNFLDSKIGWDTPLYDAIYKSVRMVSTEPAGKRAVIVMTDGRDERDNAQGVPVNDAGSLSTPDDPINEANRHNIPIFSVGLVGLGGKIDTKYLRRLAERTGGDYKEAPEPEELTPSFQDVVGQLKHQYVLVYDSSLVQDDNEHSIMVRVQLPQGQAWNDTKFTFRPESDSQPENSESSDATPTAVALAQETASPAQSPTPEPTASGIEGFIDDIQETVEDDPILVAVIGAGLLLLLILIVALVVVLIRGRRGEEPYYADEYEDMYPAAPSEMAEPTGFGQPTAPPIPQERTEVAPADWPQVGTSPTPGAPPAVPPPVGAPARPGPGIPASGETRVIERAPKHLAMLVDRVRPDRKYDLKGTTNVGRAQDNQIVLDHPTVSRHHAWVKAEGEEFLVFDIGSANGTFVNDERVEQPRLLQHGDVVRFGEEAFVFTKVF